MVDEVQGTGGDNLYQIVALGQSTFWKKVKKKNAEWRWLDVGSASIESD